MLCVWKQRKIYHSSIGPRGHLNFDLELEACHEKKFIKKLDDNHMQNIIKIYRRQKMNICRMLLLQEDIVRIWVWTYNKDHSKVINRNDVSGWGIERNITQSPCSSDYYSLEGEREGNYLVWYSKSSVKIIIFIFKIYDSLKVIKTNEEFRCLFDANKVYIWGKR